MSTAVPLSRRALGKAMLGLAAASALRVPLASAAAPDGAGAVTDMVAALQAARALSFSAHATFGASVATAKLKPLGSRASVVFERPDSPVAVFGGGGEPDGCKLAASRAARRHRSACLWPPRPS